MSGDSDQPMCRMCLGSGIEEPAVVLVAMDKGCACYPDDREQWLCQQHMVCSEPIGSFEVVGLAPGVRMLVKEGK